MRKTIPRRNFRDDNENHFSFIIAGLVSVQLLGAAGSEEAAEGGGISIDQTFDEPVTLTVQSWFPTEDILNPQLAAFSAEFPT